MYSSNNNMASSLQPRRPQQSPATAALAAASRTSAGGAVSPNTTIPNAPYPPMVVEHRFPSSGTMSSPATPNLAAAVATSATGAVVMPRPGSMSSAPGGSLIMVKQQQIQHQDSPSSHSTAAAAAAASVGGSTHSLPTAIQQPQLVQHFAEEAQTLAAAAAATGKQQYQQQQQRVLSGPCRIGFCDSRHVASINNEPIVVPAAAVDTSPLTASAAQAYGSSSVVVGSTVSSAAPRPRKKVGPVLLELQRLELNKRESFIDDDGDGDLFVLRTVARSRGNPSLGTSINSTCLDVFSRSSVSEPTTSSFVIPPPPCATGLTTGALCIHTFGISDGDGGVTNSNSLNANPMADILQQHENSSSLAYSCSVDYFHTPQNKRPATAVAWQPLQYTVAIAWASRTTNSSSEHQTASASSGAAAGGTASTASGGVGGIGNMLSVSGSSATGLKHRYDHRGGIAGTVVGGIKTSSVASSLGRVGAAAGVGVGVGQSSSDRDYGCFVWDVSQSSAAGSSSASSSLNVHHKRTTSSTSGAAPPGAAPIAKLAHQSGVSSLAWVMDPSSPTLAVGGQLRNVQIYDLRQPSSPVTVYAHNFGVDGIQTDPHRSHLFATFCSVQNEPVKIWDARSMDAHMSEIKVGSSSSMSKDGSLPTGVTSIEWSTSQPGSLAIAVGDSISEYDTITSTRPIYKSTSYARSFIADFCLQREAKLKDDGDLLSVLYPRRALVIQSDRTVHDIALHRVAPLAVSRRDGRLVHGLGNRLWMEPTNKGPSAMENLEIRADEDISATMMRRARCLHSSKYSMDTKANIRMLAEDGIEADDVDNSVHPSISTRDALLRLWGWVERVESLCADSRQQDDSYWDGAWNWPAKGLIDAGAIELLRVDETAASRSLEGDGSAGLVDQEEFCEALSCTIYHSTGRRAAMTSCGWAGRFDLLNVISECEDLGEFERAAALAVWHADIGAAVEALQRGASSIRTKLSENKGVHSDVQYAETLELVALCIAGYHGGEANSPTSNIWRRACANLMKRSDLSAKRTSMSGVAYLLGMLKFLMSLGSDNGYQEVLFDKSLSLCDRAAFACRYLERSKLQEFLTTCITLCKKTGNIEGMTITGIEREGIKILQSYVDRYADVQTAALVTSRVILPTRPDWAEEKKACAEWLGEYRGLLNTWQMWQSRAMFDVDRADLLRKVKARQLAAESNHVGSVAGGAGKMMPGNFSTGRRFAPPARKPSRHQTYDPDVQAAVPAQIDARCNYCSAPLGLSRQKDIVANARLSKMKPVLSSCPSCQKPLPRCSICMLPLGMLNPYTELAKERSRPARTSSGRQSPEDYSTSMANLPFAEWPAWCLKCGHVGHLHHLVGWFAKHDECPVSGCNCRCQFDGIQKICRPALTLDKRNEIISAAKTATTDEGASAALSS